MEVTGYLLRGHGGRGRVLPLHRCRNLALRMSTETMILGRGEYNIDKTNAFDVKTGYTVDSETV